MRSKKGEVASILLQAERREIGEKLRALRKYRGLTLVQLSKGTGCSVSALSKMENECLGLTYHKMTRLAVAFDVDMSALFADGPPIEGPQPVGRRSIARKGKSVSTANYGYLYIAPDLSRKQMAPIVVKIRAAGIEEFGPLIRHGGEH